VQAAGGAEVQQAQVAELLQELALEASPVLPTGDLSLPPTMLTARMPYHTTTSKSPIPNISLKIFRNRHGRFQRRVYAQPDRGR
jgi:hypothetical protein